MMKVRLERGHEIEVTVGDSGVRALITWEGSHLITTYFDAEGDVIDEYGEGVNC